MPAGDRNGKDVPLYQIRACLIDAGLEGCEGSEGAVWKSGESGEECFRQRKSQCKGPAVGMPLESWASARRPMRSEQSE